MQLYRDLKGSLAREAALCFLAGMWGCGSWYWSITGGLCSSGCPGLGAMGLAGCPSSIRRLACPWWYALLHHLVLLVLFTDCSHDLGEGHKQATTFLKLWLLGMHWLPYSKLPLLRLRAFCVRPLPLHGEHRILIWRCCFPGLSEWFYLVPNWAKVTFVVNYCILAKDAPLKCSR